MDDSIKPKKKSPLPTNRNVVIAIGTGLIVLSIVSLGIGLWETFWGGGHVQMVQVPGFHELNLDVPGLYAGLYQHRGSQPLPVKALAHLDVRIMSKGDYEEIPVLVNTTGQTYERFGMRGMPVFNFVVEKPGIYTMSAVYNGEEKGPDIPVFIIPQAVQNIKQTLIVGLSSFVLFLAAGIFVFVRLKHWAPKNNGPH